MGRAHVGESLVVRARLHDHDRDRAADGQALAVAPRGAGHDRPVLVAHPRVLRLVHGRADPADLDRRRRGADLRDLQAPPGTVGRPDGDRDHRAWPRRRRDRAPRRDRVRARDRALRRHRLPLARGGVRLRHAPPDRALLRALGAAAAREAASAARPAPRRAAVALVLRRRASLPRPHRPPAQGVPVHDRDPGGADPRDLGLVQGRRDRPQPTHLLRDGPAVLPRAARALHAERLRRAGGVLRQLPRQRRRRAPTQAFAAGFLFFLVTVVLAAPGGCILLWESVRGGPRPEVEHG